MNRLAKDPNHHPRNANITAIMVTVMETAMEVEMAMEMEMEMATIGIEDLLSLYSPFRGVVHYHLQETDHIHLTSHAMGVVVMHLQSLKTWITRDMVGPAHVETSHVPTIRTTTLSNLLEVEPLT